MDERNAEAKDPETSHGRGDDTADRLNRRLSLASAFLSTVAVAGAMFFATCQFESNTAKVTHLIGHDLRNQLKDVGSALERQQNLIDRIVTQLEALRSSPPKSTIAADVEELKQIVFKMDSRLASLEGAVTQDPEKALSLPLLRKDVDSLESAHQEDLNAVREEVERVYDLNKWFIGLMITIALSVWGLAIGNVVRGRPER